MRDLDADAYKAVKFAEFLQRIQELEGQLEEADTRGKEDSMTEKEKRGREIYKTLPAEFNVYPFLMWDIQPGQPGLHPMIDYEKLADWFEAQERRE